MATESRYGWELPDLGDVADGPLAFTEFANDVSDTMYSPTLLTYTPTLNTMGVGARQPTLGGTRQGHYQVRNGWCSINVFLDFGTAIDGGSGQIYVNLPLPGSTINEGLLQCKTLIAGVGNFSGYAYVNAGVARAYPYFPLSGGDNRHAGWQNAEINQGAGTGWPRADGVWGTTVNGNFSMSGRYYVG